MMTLFYALMGKVGAFLLGLVLLIVIVMYFNSAPKRDNSAKFQPVVNLHPRYFLTVSGNISPKLKKSLKVVWHVDYSTNNPKCQVWPNNKYNIGGVKTDREISYPFPIIPDGKGNYQINIPLDKLQPGFCYWRMAGAYFDYIYRDKKVAAYADTALSFLTPATPFNKTIKESWHCGNQKCTLGESNSQYIKGNLSITRNWSYTLNFLSGEPH